MIGNMKWKEQREQNPLILSSNEYKFCVLEHEVFTKSTQVEFYLEHGMIGNMKSTEQKEQNPPFLSLNEYRSFLTILFKTMDWLETWIKRNEIFQFFPWMNIDHVWK